ncbi:hypothetical protein PYW07_000035 [Mythimna separata]|uniref:Cyclic nucleotide-binding domain-containing protein n=1 Tax=Mythimna separata TaxID=271217 RepID=A0AAD8E0R5_MYTSE|nr:hypothetical protein PYW07_000035 [Mythimna separata]
MYQNHEFHDSYYYHTCVVATEKDVLETDIASGGCVAKLIRWWHGLFLLSYTSGRARGFYNSSHAMKMERFKQFRKYKHRIHPMSKFRNVWDFLILHVFIINKIIFIFTSSFIYSELPKYIFCFGAVCELIIIADLYVNLKTGYIDHEAKRVILDTQKSLLYYCTHKVFIHVAASMPLHWLMFLRYGHKISCGLCKANRFICALKIISIFSLFRVIEASAYYTRKCRSSNIHQFFKFLRIATIGFVTLCQFYDLSDAIILLVAMGTGSLAPSKLGIRASLKYVCPNCNKSNGYNFGLAVNRILKSFQLHSFGMAERIYYLDRVTALIGYGICKVFYAWTLFECYALLSPYVYPEDRSMHLRKKVLNILSVNQLSDDLNLKVRQYFDFRPTRFKAMEKDNELIRMLPEVLKKEAKLSCYLKLMMRIPYFTDFTLPILEEIVLLLREEIYLKNTIVAEAWVPAPGLMILDNGVLAVYSRDKREQGHLIDGDFFGGLSLVTDKEVCTSFVVTVTTCTILLLDKHRFRNLMRNHADQFAEMKMQMKGRYSKSDVDGLVSTGRVSELSQPLSVKYWQRQKP